ncbi:MAG TPA: histidine phosphatase family protein [Patescibacteria group bacterium]|nr:histidine phosphatase family protein [Patescibacteria group bacterium]
MSAIEGGRRFLVRHGESDTNKEKVVNGLYNDYLTSYGRQQAAEAGEILKPHGIHVIIHSPLERASDSAYIIQEITGADIILKDSALYEMDYGVLTGQRIIDVIEIAKAHPEKVFQAGANRTFVFGLPKMGNPQDVYDRVSSMLTVYNGMFPRKNVVYVGHGISLAMAYGAYHHISWQEAFARFHIPTGGVHELTIR